MRRGLLLLAALALGALLVAKREAVGQVLAVFAYAAAFTLLLSPVATRLTRRGFRPHAAAAVAMLGFLLCAALIVAAFVPYLIAHTVELVRRLAPTVAQLVQRGGSLLAQLGVEASDYKALADMVASSASQLTAGVARGGVALATQAGRIAFSLVLAYYLLCERQKAACHLLLCLPMAWRTPFVYAVRACANAVMSYLSGVLKTSAFVALATCAGLMLLGVRDAPLLSLLMGVFEVLPYVGPVLAAVPILLSTLSQGVTQTLLALGVIVLVQQIEGNFISPYFTASSTSIHPLSALVAVFVLGSLLGLWGIVLAVPLTVTLRSALWSIRQAETMIKQNEPLKPRDESCIMEDVIERGEVKEHERYESVWNTVF